MRKENVFHGGKYGSGILFIGADAEQTTWPYMSGKLLKRTAGQPYRALRGEFWIGGNNTCCFKPTEVGKHVLFVQDWKMSTEGYDLLELPALWSKTTRSNNGRSGVLYAVCCYADVKEWC